jgi:hypothetical protein
MTAPLPTGAPRPLPAPVRDLLAAHGLGDAAVRFATPSATRVDTGGWLRGGQVWAAVVGERFVLVATGPRPLLIRLPLSALSRAVYNHVTGELGFPPVPSGSDIPPVQLDPLVARALLSLAAAPLPTSPGIPIHA